ncbi:MAG: CpaD family pilus assembly protein [Alphaproteobacteria bacterium]|nr:CpaD family pilus assembly protein [Alphaproteobacteria bacterium]MBV9692967.1 CpaD family pilus assembly protein [Alphaproteobacteria bacterium]
MINRIFRPLAFATLLLSGSCAGPDTDGPPNFSDPVQNHPIAVEPDFHTIRLPFSATEAGLMPDDAARFSVFVAEYLASGNGAISISAPPGSSANVAIGYFGERLAQYGVPRERILVGTRNEPGDGKVEIGYMAYKAHVENCTPGGDWSKDWSDTVDNQPTPNFGCAVQSNMAAQLSDPRDLVQPRTMDDPDAVRRNAMMGHYEKGEITQADKHTADKSVEQSGQSSEIQ